MRALGLDKFSIVLLHAFSCNSKDELHQKEQEYIDQLNPELNKNCAYVPPCPHGREKGYCKDCNGVNFCEHGKEKRYCKECGGNGICEHGKRKSTCKDCSPAYCPWCGIITTKSGFKRHQKTKRCKKNKNKFLDQIKNFKLKPKDKPKPKPKPKAKAKYQKKLIGMFKKLGDNMDKKVSGLREKLMKNEISGEVYDNEFKMLKLMNEGYKVLDNLFKPIINVESETDNETIEINKLTDIYDNGNKDLDKVIENMLLYARENGVNGNRTLGRNVMKERKKLEKLFITLLDTAAGNDYRI